MLLHLDALQVHYYIQPRSENFAFWSFLQIISINRPLAKHFFENETISQCDMARRSGMGLSDVSADAEPEPRQHQPRSRLMAWK
jgi:hypothetical protein